MEFNWGKQPGIKKAEKVIRGWQFHNPSESKKQEKTEEKEESAEISNSAAELIKEAVGDAGEKPDDIEEVLDEETQEEQPAQEEMEEEKQEIIIAEEEPSTKVIGEGEPQHKEQLPQGNNRAKEAAALWEASSPKPPAEIKKEPPAPKDELVAKSLHKLIMQCGWSPTKTTPEKDYFFYSYLPPVGKRSWMQARVYIPKLNLKKPLKVEGLTILPGMEERLIIIIRMQKSGGIDRIMNSKTITENLDMPNYFNENSELVNEADLADILSSYLRDAEIV